MVRRWFTRSVLGVLVLHVLICDHRSGCGSLTQICTVVVPVELHSSLHRKDYSLPSEGLNNDIGKGGLINLESPKRSSDLTVGQVPTR